MKPDGINPSNLFRTKEMIEAMGFTVSLVREDPQPHTPVGGGDFMSNGCGNHYCEFRATPNTPGDMAYLANGPNAEDAMENLAKAMGLSLD